MTGQQLLDNLSRMTAEELALPVWMNTSEATEDATSIAMVPDANDGGSRLEIAGLDYTGSPA